ncbi:FDLD family class I lanthipeptide [Cytobacillus sp. Hm23]
MEMKDVFDLDLQIGSSVSTNQDRIGFASESCSCKGCTVTSCPCNRFSDNCEATQFSVCGCGTTDIC